MLRALPGARNGDKSGGGGDIVLTIDMGAQTGRRTLGGVQSRCFKPGGQETMSDVDLSKLTGEG